MNTTTQNRRRRRQFNTLAGIASLLVVTLYVVNLGFTPNQSSKSTRANNAIDMSADGTASTLTIERYNEQGEIDHKLTADTAEFYRDNQHLKNARLNSTTPAMSDEFENDTAPATEQLFIKMQNPIIKIFDQKATVAELNANSAYIDTSTQYAYLSGGVRVIGSVNNTLLLTETLNLDTSVKQIFSRDTVKVFSPNSSTIAEGIQGNIADQRWQLLSDVRSVITP